MSEILAPIPSEDDCLRWLWRETHSIDGVHAHCAKCGAVRKHHRVGGRRAYACDRCGAHIYPTSGTLFERSNTGLSEWFRAIVLVISGGSHMPAKRLTGELGVGYKTALRMRTRILRDWEAGDAPTHLIIRIFDAMEAHGALPRRPKSHESVRKTSSSTRMKILEAASASFSRRGLAGTRIADIAREADVSTATVHHYFGGKAQVFLAALEWSSDQADEKMLSIRRESPDPLEALRRILLWNVPREDSPNTLDHLWLEVVTSAQRHPELVQPCARLSTQWQDFVEEMIQEGTRSGEFHPVAPASEVAKRVASMLTGTAIKSAVGYRGWRHEQVVQVLFWFVADQLGLPPEALGVYTGGVLPSPGRHVQG